MSRQRLECGGERSATPLWLGQRLGFPDVPGGRNPDSARSALAPCDDRRWTSPGRGPRKSHESEIKNTR